MTPLIVTANFPQVRYRFYSIHNSTILTDADEETEDNDLATAGNYFSSKLELIEHIPRALV